MIPMRDKHDFMRAIDNRIRSLRGRVRGLATRFVLGKSSRASGDLARARGETYAGDATDGDEIMQHYGFASLPVSGAEGVRVSVFSDGDHGVIVALDDRRYRPTLADGEVAAYHKDGAKVHLKADGSIVLVPSGTGIVHIGADPSTEKLVKGSLFLPLYNAHAHPSPIGPIGGPLATPMVEGTHLTTKVKAT